MSIETYSNPSLVIRICCRAFSTVGILASISSIIITWSCDHKHPGVAIRQCLADSASSIHRSSVETVSSVNTLVNSTTVPARVDEEEQGYVEYRNSVKFTNPFAKISAIAGKHNSCPSPSFAQFGVTRPAALLEEEEDVIGFQLSPIPEQIPCKVRQMLGVEPPKSNSVRESW